jgi:hypothetical protein
MELTRKRVLVIGTAEFFASHLFDSGGGKSPPAQVGCNEPPT